MVFILDQQVPHFVHVNDSRLIAQHVELRSTLCLKGGDLSGQMSERGRGRCPQLGLDTRHPQPSLVWSGQECIVPIVNMLEAKSSLSRLVEAVESGAETEIIIARNGRPAARLVAIKAAPAGKRIGVAKGKFEVPDDIDADAATIAALFTGRAE